MPPTTRNKRTPIWDSVSWLEESYNISNGVPGFFVEGGYSFDNREMAEEDYMFSVDQAIKSSNKDFAAWAHNIRLNKYSPMSLAIVKEYWKNLIQEELSERKTRKLNEVLLRGDVAAGAHCSKKQKRMPSTSNDLLFVDGLRESVGTVIRNKAKATTISDYKSNYFKTLGMNKIIDLSDHSAGSHLDLFGVEHQKHILDSLCSESKQTRRASSSAARFEEVIEKHADIEEEDHFLRRCIREIELEKEGKRTTKKAYLQILESMSHHKYLYVPEEDNSEADYINKLYSPIMEACFQNHGIRLRWGETIPGACKKVDYAAKIDLRVTIPCADLSAVEYAKKFHMSKYYKDKVKIVLCSLIYYRTLYKKTRNDRLKIPSMIIARLEGEILTLRWLEGEWFVLEKAGDVDTPPNVESVKKGGIKQYMNDLTIFEDHCLELKKQVMKHQSSKGKAKEENATRPAWQDKSIWFSNFELDSDDVSDNED